MILAGGPLISRACRGETGPSVALGLVPRIGPQPIAKGLTTKTEPKLSKISLMKRTEPSANSQTSISLFSLTRLMCAEKTRRTP